MTRHRDLEAELDPSIVTARHLRATADAWPDLLAALGRRGTSSVGPVTGSSGNPLPIDMDVSELIRQVKEWVAGWARALEDETRDWTPPPGDWLEDVPGLLHAIAGRTGHFTKHHDQVLALAFIDECSDMKHRVEAVAYPDGTRRVPTNMRCLETGCEGEYRGIVPPDSRWTEIPDLRCTENRVHIITPEELRRIQRQQQRGRLSTRPADVWVYLARLRERTPLQGLTAALSTGVAPRDAIRATRRVNAS